MTRKALLTLTFLLSLAVLHSQNNIDYLLNCQCGTALTSGQTDELKQLLAELRNIHTEIKKGEFVYLITPLVDRNIYYSEKKYTKINNVSVVEANILGFNIILYQNTFDILTNTEFHFKI